MLSLAFHPDASRGGPFPDPLRVAIDGLPARRFGILGVDVRLRTDSAAVGGFFDHAYRWFAPDDEGEPLELAAIFTQERPADPIVIAGGEPTHLGRSPSPENHAFLILIGAIMDRIRRALCIHGAAVSLDGEGIILAGPAFAGKSTLVMALMKRGCDFMSDDAAPLDRRTGMLLPYPRAVGVRKSANRGGAPLHGALPGNGTLELPHRWLVDPQALGARLPVPSCRPTFLFYLDPSGWSSGDEEGAQVYEIILADEPGRLRSELEEIGASIVEEIPARPFPGLAARFTRPDRVVPALARLRQRHRDRILFFEQRRPAVPRHPGPPEIARTPASSLLIPLVRDLLNRGDEGLLMKEHGGRIASLVMEMGALLSATRTYRVTAGSPDEIASRIVETVRRREDR